LPSGTGLGSSGSFTTALIKALYANQKIQINMRDLAEMACDIEINQLGAPIGKQDQYIASYGGIKEFTIKQDGLVGVKKCNISSLGINNLEDSLMLFFTGYSRNANSILSEQNNASKNNDSNMTDNLHKVKELGLRSKIALENNNILEFGEIMNEHWLHKKKRSSKMSNGKIDEWYKHALENGAIGGKLVGAGAGGFLLFVTQDKSLLRKALERFNLTEVKIRFDFEGTKFVMVD
jgi:D-glycero-alpha-D-manno-heptose-7-phosphate kinase